MKKLQEKYLEIIGNVEVCCGDGWYTLLDTLCGSIQSHIEFSHRRKKRWGGDACEPVVAAQIKEKFGGLRFYYDGGDEFVRGLVSMAESLSEHICEVCGNAGKQRGGRWVSTLCDEHDKQRAAPAQL